MGKGMRYYATLGTLLDGIITYPVSYTHLTLPTKIV